MRESGEWVEWGIEVSRGELLYREWINNKVLLHGTGNYIQYSIINHNGKEYLKVCVCIYIYIHTHVYLSESLYCRAEINATL